MEKRILEKTLENAIELGHHKLSIS